MTIAITGASGFIGRHLTQYFATKGRVVKPISRDMLHHTNMDALQRTIDSCEVVINLAGETIDQIWSASIKQSIIESRVITTRTIVESINRSAHPKLLISASAVGIYPSSGCHDEHSRGRNRTFLGEVCRAWEHEAKRLNRRHRLAITRFGVVFAQTGGALERMVATRRFGFLPRLGSDKRDFSWVSIEDLTRAIDFIVHRDDLHGAINICAPELTTQRIFTDAASRHFGIGVTLPIPDFIIRMVRGEAVELILQDQCVVPRKLNRSGFRFDAPTIDLFFQSLRQP